MTTEFTDRDYLLEAHRQVTRFKGRRYRLDAQMIQDRFFCTAECLDPQTPEEVKFCHWDLLLSESEDTYALVDRFIQVGRKIVEAA